MLQRVDHKGVWVRKRLLIILTMALLTNEFLYAQKSTDLLFFLQLGSAVQTVAYELNYNKDGNLCQDNPVKISWISDETGQQFKALTRMDKRMVYGVQSKQIGTDEYEIRLLAYKKMPMYLLKSETSQKYQIYIKDEGKNLLLKRVSVSLIGNKLWRSKVRYIDLMTTNSAGGVEILKRIKT